MAGISPEAGMLKIDFELPWIYFDQEQSFQDH